MYNWREEDGREKGRMNNQADVAKMLKLVNLSKRYREVLCTFLTFS